MKKRISLLLVFLLLMGVLVACGGGEEAPEEPETTEDVTEEEVDEEEAEEAEEVVATDMETDVLVIGAGGAGMAAAVSAAEEGAQVVIVEKMPMVGGNTSRATGGINAAGTDQQAENDVEDDVETFIADTMKGGHDKNDPELVRTLAENSKDAIDWLVSYGADLSDVGMGGGATNKRFHRPTGGAAVGGEVVNTLKNAVDENDNITLLLETEAVEIFKDDAVTGAQVVSKDGEFNITANAVVVATGGFSADEEMVIEYKPELEGFATTNHAGASGQGIQMAIDIGADTVDMEEIQTHPTVVPEKGIMITEAVRGNGAILLNREGTRFIDELETRDVVSEAVLAQTGSSAFLVFNDEIKESLGAIESYFNQGLVTEGTAEELAEALGIEDAEAIKASISAYNDGRANANDEFGRELMEVEFDPEGMLYAIEITPAVHHTMGGLRIDTEAQVLDAEGNPIPGLFAAGECTGGVHGGNRLGGNAMADIIVFGRISGTNAAK